MTDREMIDEARERSRDAYLSVRTQNVLCALADRLEQLAAPVASGPIAPARLDAIRETLRQADLHKYALHRDHVRELLAAYDHERKRADECEQMVANTFDDSKVARLAEAAGVAKALGVIDAVVAKYPPPSQRGYGSAACCDVLTHLRAVIDERCGPAQLPPHLESLARLRRLEGALQKILAESRIIDLNDANKVMHVERIAREALSEDAP